MVLEMRSFEIGSVQEVAKESIASSKYSSRTHHESPPRKVQYKAACLATESEIALIGPAPSSCPEPVPEAFSIPHFSLPSDTLVRGVHAVFLLSLYTTTLVQPTEQSCNHGQ